MKFSKKLLSLLLCAVMVLGSVAVGGEGIDELLNIFSVNVSAYSNWSEAYREFTVGNRYKNFDVDYDKNIVPEPFDSNEERIGLFLYDMDNDGVPELFMSNGFLGRETAYSYIFTVSDGNIKYLDSVYHNIGYTNNSKYKGVFTISHYGYTYYFEKSGLKINRKDVAFEDKENGRKVTVYNQELNNCKIEYFNEVNLSELRIMGWSAFCSKYGFKTTDNQTTGKSDSISYSKPILKYTGKDNSVLKDFLQSCYFLGYYNTGSYFAFDSNEVTTYTLMNNLLSSKKYSYFSDIDYVEDYSGKSSDPRKIYGYAYRKTNASQLNWLLKNVFNYNEQSIRKMKDNGESIVAQNKFDGFYEEGGYYYCSAADGIGSSSGIKTIINSSTEINGYTYVEYTVEEYEYYDLKKLTGSTKLYAQLKYKSSDGQYYWSLYKNANKKFWDEDKVEKEDGTGKYKIEYSNGKSDAFEYNLDYYIDKTDSWEIADQKDFKDVDVEKGRTVTTEWGGNASADKIELTEGVQPEGVIGNVLPKKGEGNTRTIIIVVAALVVVLAVLFAVFLIVRKKKNGSQEELPAVQDEENIVKAEPPVVERTAKTVNGSSGNDEITFVCTELFESGICDICKNEIAKPVSLEINSRGNEKKYTVCASCAQKAIRKIKDMK